MNKQNKNNNVMMIGNLGMAPVVKTLDSGKQVARFSIAQHTYYNGTKTTHWFNVVIWGDLAEQAATQLNKGQRVSISGRLTTREFQPANEPRRILTEIVATDFNRVLETVTATDEQEEVRKAS